MRYILSVIIAAVFLITNAGCSVSSDFLLRNPGKRSGHDSFSAGSASLEQQVIAGAGNMENYIDLLQEKSVGVAANHTSVINGRHLVDTLFALNIDVRKIFTPEHGFRGTAGAGELISSGRDEKTGLPILSLYGTSRKPQLADLEDLDVLLFDIQDVGVRFYTYISTLQFLMEGCAEVGVKVIVLDRPNPNGSYIDGPVLDRAYSSFIGMQPVPVVYGMTIGEYALMINGEGWLEGGVKCDLEVIPCTGYSHDTMYDLPVAPSPNLPDRVAVQLYPSLCFFEGTDISVGRGTPFPFRVFGHPDLTGYPFSFTPKSVEAAPNPPHINMLCHGLDLTTSLFDGTMPSGQLELGWLINAYHNFPDKDSFFNTYFDRLAGNSELRSMIIAGNTPDQIRESWQSEIEKFLLIRKKYLLYD